MAASSASANCLGNTEVLGWFKDVDKKRSLFALFIKSQAILRRHPAEWARENWASACEGMRDVMRDPDLAGVTYGLICEILENFNQQLEDTLEEGGGKRKKGARKEREVKRKPEDQTLAAEPRAAVEVLGACAEPQGNASSFAIHCARRPCKQKKTDRKERTRPPEFLVKVEAFKKFLMQKLGQEPYMLRLDLNKAYCALTRLASFNMAALWKNVHRVKKFTAVSTTALDNRNIVTQEKTVLTCIGSVALCDTTLYLYGCTSSTSKGDSDSSDTDGEVEDASIDTPYLRAKLRVK
jgi:hypothetical protein